MYRSIYASITTETKATAVRFSPVYEIVGFFFFLLWREKETILK
jgi:hypothetical protein